VEKEEPINMEPDANGVYVVTPPDPVELEIRDRVLRSLEERRGLLIAEARRRARDLAIRREVAGCAPHVHAPEILKAIRADPDMADLLRGLDPRWMGPVFRTSEWRYTGKTINSGTHGRPARIWELVG
jgi:hypothetical protein